MITTRIERMDKANFAGFPLSFTGTRKIRSFCVLNVSDSVNAARVRERFAVVVTVSRFLCARALECAVVCG